jgi:hypothetical protein
VSPAAEPGHALAGIKSVAAVGLTAMLVALGALRHALDASYLQHLTGEACFLVGLVASLAVALLGVGWRFRVRSTAGVVVVRGRPTLVDDARPRELPGVVQQALLLCGFAAVVVGALGNHAAARIQHLPDELAAPAPSEYCLPEPAAPAAPSPAAAPPPPQLEPPGCALVKRAFQLGYAKTLGACAPRPAAAPVAISPVTRREVCTRRQLDEPFLHYGYRRVAGAFGAATSVDPVAAAEHRVTDVRTHIAYLDGLLADIRHAITGTPHAAHHLWVDLPDPHPGSLRDRFTGAVRCSQRFADLPLWPAWRAGEEAALVEHVLGQLLFATRFGTTASCSDYVIHWNALPDTCRRLAADPIAVLVRDGALASIRAVLDRRARQLELGALAAALGRPAPPIPPAAAAIVSLSCFAVDAPPSAGSGSTGVPPAGAASTGSASLVAGRAATGETIAIDGDRVGLREIHVPAVRTGDDGPIDVYLELAALLAGQDGNVAAAARAAARTSPPEPVEPSGGDFLLARLDPLIDADPFRGARAALSRAELIEVYPFQHHLHGFIDGFRRRYLAQRGRL